MGYRGLQQACFKGRCLQIVVIYCRPCTAIKRIRKNKSKTIPSFVTTQMLILVITVSAVVLEDLNCQ